jgi:hypothetical protein
MMRIGRASQGAALAAGYALLVFGASCDFQTGSRWFLPEIAPAPPLCAPGEQRCTAVLEECVEADGVLAWVTIDDCAAQGLVCAPTLLRCTTCIPDQPYCDGQDVRQCLSDGNAGPVTNTCDPSVGQACRNGSCQHLCTVAAEEKSNVGCEYWAVDLDNARIDVTRNAAAQQFAVVVSNPQPDVPVVVRIEQDNGAPGDAPEPIVIAEATVAPLNLRVFKLGPREVDGSPEGEFDTGTHSALTRHGYRITSDFPVVSYQFNPLENVNVFSNDASLLKPREAVTNAEGSLARAYVVVGWPQTIAITDDPNTNFSSVNPTNLRAFLTIVGTRPDTTVVVRPTTDVRGGGGVPTIVGGGEITMTIDAFDVVNMETPDLNAFGADFTGTIVDADQPVVVFVGSEASDAPHFDSLIYRRCCADHLEEQLDPVRTAGKRFALAHSPRRTPAVQAAGGDLGISLDEPEYVRFVATRDALTTITTTLPSPDDVITLSYAGDAAEVLVSHDFLAESDEPIHVMQISASQDAANVPRALPGGDPSLLVVPPREQYRADYVFLTPDKYAFDFVTVVAENGANVFLDGQLLDSQRCEILPTDGLSDEERAGAPVEVITYNCQLSFPTVNPDSGEVGPGQQNDGVHRIVATAPVGVTVFGFDAFVSYAYAAGTDLREIAPPE